MAVEFSQNRVAGGRREFGITLIWRRGRTTSDGTGGGRGRRRGGRSGGGGGGKVSQLVPEWFRQNVIAFRSDWRGQWGGWAGYHGSSTGGGILDDYGRHLCYTTFQRFAGRELGAGAGVGIVDMVDPDDRKTNDDTGQDE